MLTMLVPFAFLISFLLRFNTYDDNAQDAIMAVNAEPIEVLFEHKVNEGNILLYRTLGGDELSLAFLSRDFTGIQYIDSATQYDITALEEQAGITYVVLPKSEKIPFTIYGGLTTNTNLNEIFVTEPSFQIAHSIHMMEPLNGEDNLHVWLAASADFTGHSFSIIGLANDGTIIGDIEHDGTRLTIHSIDIGEAQ